MDFSTIPLAPHGFRGTAGPLRKDGPAQCRTENRLIEDGSDARTVIGGMLRYGNAGLRLVCQRATTQTKPMRTVRCLVIEHHAMHPYLLTASNMD